MASQLGTVLIAIVAIALILYRQTTERPIKQAPFRLPLILLAIGVYDTGTYLQHQSDIEIGGVAAVLVGFVVAALIAVPRANSIRIRRDPSGRLVGRGGALTVALWVVAIAAHIAISVLVPAVFSGHIDQMFSGLDGATILVYLAISLGVQALITQRRVAQLSGTTQNARHLTSAD